MKFFTAVQLPEYPFSIGYKDKVFLIGSCFTENISRHLEYRKFQICENPFGIVYNPLSIYRTIERVGRKEKYSENDLFHFDGLYHSFDHHGSFSGKDASMVLDLINNNINSGSLFIRESNLLILTFGTSYVYEKKSDGHVVANCHKVPDDQFSRRLMDVDEIVNEWKGVYDLLKEVNPDLRVLITVSPVRHFRDGMTANQRSKATLILAAHQICEQSPNVFYVPSY